jgi:hypothetical protein
VGQQQLHSGCEMGRLIKQMGRRSTSFAHCSVCHSQALAELGRCFYTPSGVDRQHLASCRYNIVNKRLPGWQDPPTRDAIQVCPTHPAGPAAAVNVLLHMQPCQL